jgi:acyl carrier protein
VDIQQFIQELEGNIEGVEPGSLQPGTVFRELPVWDSLAALTTLSAVDAVFGLQITGPQLRQCQTIQDIADMALRLRAGTGSAPS